jgi:hypothetical protein
MSRVPSLLWYSYKCCKDIDYNNRNIINNAYDDVICETKERIREILHHHMGKMVLKCIYIVRTCDPITAIEKILITPPSDYKGSVWRIAMYYAVSSWIRYPNNNDRLKDVMDTVDMLVSFSDYIIRERVNDKLEIIDKAMKLEQNDPDIWMYIEAYNAIGPNLNPNTHN